MLLLAWNQAEVGVKVPGMEPTLQRGGVKKEERAFDLFLVTIWNVCIPYQSAGV